MTNSPESVRDWCTWLVLPTYNEAPNIESIVSGANEALGGTVNEHHILVVDDGSPDGTGRIADRLAGENPAVEVLHRTEKTGLGRAYLAGFEYVLARGADLVIEMDADHSHDPCDLPRLVAASATADVVLGSRYVEGGGVRDWPLARRLLSRGGSWYARRLLGVEIRDLTGGFKCFRRDALKAVDYHNSRASGYGFQIELTYRAVEAGMRVVEVPIVFRDRQLGRSKMSASIAVEAMWQVPALRLGARGRRPAGGTPARMHTNTWTEASPDARS
jgi:dolichol-phosphate mannosyltransferase